MATIELNDPLLKKIGQFADEQNFQIFVVGGYVRDTLLGKERTDIDITVVGDSLQFAKMLADHFHSKAIIYERFRTALVPIGNNKVEFVGTRKEEYEPNSRKPITTEGTLEDDLLRRDFTINAMAAGLNSDNYGELIDLFGGIRHLALKMLVTPLEPVITYSDDPLRMMRAARFASQLQFALDENSYNAITQMAERIAIISKERIADEFLKIMNSPKPSIGLWLLYNMGLMKYICPEITALGGVDTVENPDGANFKHKDVLAHTFKVVDNVAEKSDNLWLRVAALFHDIAKPRTKRFTEGIGWSFNGHEELGAKMLDRIFRKMKFPLEHIDYVRKLVRLHLRPMALVNEIVTDSAVRRLAVEADDALEDLFLLCRCDITSKNQNLTSQYYNNYNIVAQKVMGVQEKDKLRAFQSPVRGEEIMEICNIPPSRLVGKIKHNIEEAILEGIIPNEYDAAKKYFLQHKDEWLSTIVEIKM